jgi:hypothetical protein
MTFALISHKAVGPGAPKPPPRGIAFGRRDKNFTTEYPLYRVTPRGEYCFEDIKLRFGFTDANFVEALKSHDARYFRTKSLWEYWNWKLKIFPCLSYGKPDIKNYRMKYF